MSTTITAIIDVGLDSVRRSPHNHRKTFNGLDELAASLRSKGMINPVTIRPTYETDLRKPAYELVAGERRWRAAKIAKLETIPAIVRDLSDLEVLEIQLIENVQREDVHPLEEADGYEELVSKHGFDVDLIAARTGKSRATIYARLKLCSLAAYPRRSFLEGRLSASIALLIARIPDEELQDRATKDVLGETDFDDVAEDDSLLGNALEKDLDNPQSPLCQDRRSIAIEDEAAERREDTKMLAPAERERIPMSVREAQIHLRRRYMLRLELATFDLATPYLVPTAGACTTCEFRTGNQRDLFTDVDSADVCTKPSCFEAKTREAWTIKAETAEAAGVQVVTAAESDRVFTMGAKVRDSSPYVDPTSPVPYDLLTADQKLKRRPPTWGDLLGKKLAAAVPTVLVQDASGAGHELLDKRKIVEVLREAGKIDKPLKPETKSSGPSSTRDPFKDQASKDQKKLEQQTRAGRAALAEAWTESGKLDLKDPAWWKWVATALVATSGGDLHGTEESVNVLLERVSSLGGYARIITAVLLSEQAELPLSGTGYHDPAKDKVLMAGLDVLGVDYEAHLERIKASDKEAAKAEKKIAAKADDETPTKNPAKKGRGK
jgi:ParB/RepB/Spo0J family partition protein